jgi:hypothetical protein
VNALTASTALKERLGADRRSLALFRIALAVVVLADLAIRARGLATFYSDAGVLPRSLLPAAFPTLWMLGGSTGWAAFLFAAEAVAALSLLAGVRPRASAFVCWILLLSRQGRNPFVLDAGDQILRVVLFWSLFLPLGDALRAGPPARSQASRKPVFTVGWAAYVIQILVIYVSSGLWKTGPAWHEDGSALSYALKTDYFATSFGHALLAHPGLLRALTFATVALERWGPLLLVFPVATGPLRLAAVLLFTALHLGIASVLKLGLFPFVDIVALLPFLPPVFWRVLRREAPPADGALRVEGVPPDPARAILRTLRDGLAIVCIVWVVAFTLGEHLPGFGVPAALRPLGGVLGLDQRWSMFSSPKRTNDWHVLPGRLADGRAVDLLRGGPLSWEKPSDVPALYRSKAWFLYLMRLVDPLSDHAALLGRFAEGLCNGWNASHPSPRDRLTYLEIALVREGTDPRVANAPPLRLSAWRQDCPAIARTGAPAWIP